VSGLQWQERPCDTSLRPQEPSLSSARLAGGISFWEKTSGQPAPHWRKKVKEKEMTELCDMCADALPAYRGRGRPRVRCEACAANGAAISAAWRKRNPEKVEAFNAARRIPWHLQRGGV
jgi:hypothetical protein